jgi:hypothetical protein
VTLAFVCLLLPQVGLCTTLQPLLPLKRLQSLAVLGKKDSSGAFAAASQDLVQLKALTYLGWVLLLTQGCSASFKPLVTASASSNTQASDRVDSVALACVTCVWRALAQIQQCMQVAYMSAHTAAAAVSTALFAGCCLLRRCLPRLSSPPVWLSCTCTASWTA